MPAIMCQAKSESQQKKVLKSSGGLFEIGPGLAVHRKGGAGVSITVDIPLSSTICYKMRYTSINVRCINVITLDHAELVPSQT